MVNTEYFTFSTDFPAGWHPSPQTHFDRRTFRKEAVGSVTLILHVEKRVTGSVTMVTFVISTEPNHLTQWVVPIEFLEDSVHAACNTLEGDSELLEGLLASLVRYPSTMVRRSLAACPFISRTSLNELAFDSDSKVRELVTEHFKTSDRARVIAQISSFRSTQPLSGGIREH